MKTASVRDLRNSFPNVARWIEEGESVEITRSGKIFAILAPVNPEPPSGTVMPDFLGRLRDLFPAEKITVNPISVVDYDRGER